MQKQVSQDLGTALDLKQVQKIRKIVEDLKQSGSESMGRYMDEIYGLEQETTGGC